MVKLMSSNPVIEAIRSRRTVRNYVDKPVSQEVIDTILEAGTWAPTGVNIQPWEFTVIKGKDATKLYSDKAKAILTKTLPQAADPNIRKRLTAPEVNLFFGAPLAIFISAAKSRFAATDCHLAAQNMMLAAYSLGLGSVYSASIMSLGQDSTTKAELGIPEDHELYSAVIFGYPKEIPKAPTRKKPQILKQIG
jgi:nitroreductase